MVANTFELRVAVAQAMDGSWIGQVDGQIVATGRSRPVVLKRTARLLGAMIRQQTQREEEATTTQN